MNQIDLVLLHAPSVYDFREASIMYGPVNELVPSTPIFEMYPIGFVALSEYLVRHGLQVRMVNLAALMLMDQNFNVEKFISSLHPRAFGIDFHWLPHAHGSLEIARIIKKYHPHTPVIFGGYSSTYYENELIKYQQVDYIVKGDSTEEPLRELLECLKKKATVDSIPNLTWKDKTDGIHSNQIDYVPEDINHISLDCTHIMRSAVKYKDLMGYVPYESWLSYPVSPVLGCRGCSHGCKICGGSAYGAKKYLNRSKPAYRDPELLAHDIHDVQRYLKGPIFVFGDIRQAGDDYADTFLEAIKKKQIKNPLVLEFFLPPPEEFFEKLSKAIPRYYLEISPDSTNNEERFALGRPYTNEEMESSIKHALQNGCQRIDLFYMSGLPKQTAASVLRTENYCEHLFSDFKGDQRIHVFIAPLGPFLDPGSMIFENPTKFGYKIIHKTLEDHRRALTNYSWKYRLNYETKWLTRDEHVECIYDSAIALNRVKAKYGIIPKEMVDKEEQKLNAERIFLQKIEELTNFPNEEKKKIKLKEYQVETKKYADASGSQIRELEWPSKLIGINLSQVMRTLIFEDSNSRVSILNLTSMILKIIFLQFKHLGKRGLIKKG